METPTGAETPFTEKKILSQRDVSQQEGSISGTEVESADFTPARKKTLTRKIDRYLLPLLALLYLLSFLDRTNIGNAKLAGLETDLNLKGLKYNVSYDDDLLILCDMRPQITVITKFYSALHPQGPFTTGKDGK